MGKRKGPKRMPTLEEQLEAHDADAPLGPTIDVFGDRLTAPSPERMQWARRRVELADAIRHRDGKRIADPGRDASGNFSPSPYVTRGGHKLEVAPKDLGKELPKDSQFPKRIATQRVLDWYRSHGHITPTEWKAGNKLWEIWCESGLEAKVTSGYEPVTSGGQASQDAKIAKRLDAVTALTVLLGDAVPYRCRGVVKAVVIEDRSASDWAKVDRRRSGDSKAHGLTRLRAGLSALARSLGY